MTTIVDASVVLAWLQGEPGGDAAEPHLMEGIIGAANWSEVLRKARQHGASIEETARLLNSFGLRVVEVNEQDAELAAALDQASSPLSLADRLCLALGMRLDLPVATADRAWLRVGGGPEVIPIR
jgi:PIN domain nuclease of toxin-antitoxin system